MGFGEFYPSPAIQTDVDGILFFSPSLQTDVYGMQVDGRSGRGRGGQSQQEKTLVMGAATRTELDGIIFSVAAQLLSVASN